MEGFDPKTSFGCETSQRYVAFEARGDEEETVAFLARMAGQHDALEFAVGTGRVALPLMQAGVRVDGIEQSQHMVDRMREKPGGESVHVVIGDMVSFGPISLRLAHAREFDLMARIAGLRLRRRAGGWDGEPFTADSWRHVGVYERAPTATAERAATATCRTAMNTGKHRDADPLEC